MKQSIKKIIRALILAIFIILAAAVGGIAGAMVLPREKFHDNEIRIEMVDRKRKGDSENESEEDDTKQ